MQSSHAAGHEGSPQGSTVSVVARALLDQAASYSARSSRPSKRSTVQHGSYGTSTVAATTAGPASQKSVADAVHALMASCLAREPLLLQEVLLLLQVMS